MKLIDTLHFRQTNPECLYVLNQYGKLSEFSLETSPAKTHQRVTDQTPLEVFLVFLSFYKCMNEFTQIIGACQPNSPMESTKAEKLPRSQSPPFEDKCSFVGL